MIYLGLSGVVSPTDTPTTTTQGTCPNGYAEAYGVCMPVTSTAPGDITETDPSKLPPAQTVQWESLAIAGLVGLIGGISLFSLKRK